MKYELFVLILLVGYLCLAVKRVTNVLAGVLSLDKQVALPINEGVGLLKSEQVDQRLASIESALEAIRGNTEGIDTIDKNVSHMRHIGVLSLDKQVALPRNEGVGLLNSEQVDRRLASIESALEAIKENTEGIDTIDENVSHMRHIGVFQATKWV